MEQLLPQPIKGYTFIEPLGKGGFGTVYRAYQAAVGRDVAIKMILPAVANHPDFICRFETEAQVIARLEHLHIVPLYDYWRDPDGTYLVMRWLKGGNLGDALKQGAYDLESTLTLITHIASALDAAHRNGIIHRDLKPANILLDEDGNAYLSDFGIAKDLTNLQKGLTAEDVIVGSLDYISPEQARSEPVTPRTDIYSLGVVLYEMLTGQHPFPNLTPVERLYKHLNEPLPTIDDATIPNSINEVIQKATAKNPAHRYTGAAEFASAFQQAAALNGEKSASPAEVLTLREQEILQLITQGLSNKEIAQKLTFTPGTVKWYTNQIYKKLHVRSRVQAIVRAREMNLVILPGGLRSADNEAMPIPTEEFQPVNPYKGLRAFKAADWETYFGQEKLIAKLLKRLAETTENHRFLAIVGPSGSGKSSLVKAGIIPALWRGELPGSERWFVAEMLPGSRLLDELEVALIRVAAHHSPSLKEQLQRDQYGLLRVASIILPDDDSELVLVIDQFEEVFTLVTDEAARSHFLDLLYTAVIAPRSRVRIIITLRADYYDRPLHYPEFGELVRSRMETILPLSAEGLERAILLPAERVGISFEAGLAASIIQEIHYQPGALPLLQYALTELFDQRRGHLLTHEAYQAIGKTTGALATRAEQIYTELGTELEEASRQMFLRLVTLGEGTEDTRRRVQRSELLAITADSDQMDEVIDTFAAYRLLTLDHDPATHTPTVEVAHEAILREWERLRLWLNDSRDDIRMQRQLTTLAQEWVDSQQDASFLLRGSRLGQFEKWAANPNLAFTHIEQEFLRASTRHHEQERIAEQQRQQREVQLEQRSRTFLRGLVAVMVIATLIAIGLTIFAFAQRSLAVQAADQAQLSADQSQSLALAFGAREALLKHDPDLALSLAVMANTIPQALSQAGDTLAEIALAPGPRQLYTGHTAPRIAMDVSADGRYLLTGSGQFSMIGTPVDDNTMRLWDIQTGEEIRRFEGHISGVWSVAFSPDGRTAFSGSDDRSVIQWDLVTGEVLRRYEGKQTFAFWNPVSRIAVSPDGNSLLIARYDGDIRRFDTLTGKEQQVFRLHISGDFITHLAFSPDGQTIYSVDMVPGSHLYNLVIWNVGDGSERHFEIGDSDIGPTGNWHLGPGGFSDVSRDGRLAISVRGMEMVVYDVATGAELQRFNRIHDRWVSTTDISPNGRTALSVGPDRLMILWNLETGAPIRTFTGADGAIFTPDGRHALSTSADGTIRLWDLDGGSELRNQSVSGFDQMGGLALSPDGVTLLSGVFNSSTRQSVVIQWNTLTGDEIRRYDGYTGFIPDVAFSPDGQRALIVSEDMTISLVDTLTGAELRRYPVTDPPRGIAFAENGRSAMLIAGLGGVFRLDLENGILSPQIEGGYMLYNTVTDGRIMPVPNSDEGETTVSLYDMTTAQRLGAVNSPFAAPSSAAVSPDEHSLLLGGGQSYVSLMNLESRTEIWRLTVPTVATVNALTFSPDSQLAAAGMSDGLILLWDVTTGQLLARFEGHDGQVKRVRFSSDGQTILSTGVDGTLRQWSLPPRSTQAWLSWTFSNRYVRELNEAERVLYNLPASTTIADIRAAYQPSLTKPVSFPLLPLPTPDPATLTKATATVQPTATIGDNAGTLASSSGQIWLFTGTRDALFTFTAVAAHPATGVPDPARQVERHLLDTWLEIRSPDGTVLATNDDYLGALDTNARIDLVLPQDGRYEVEIRASQNRTEGDYTLRIAPVLQAVEREQYTAALNTGSDVSAFALSPDGSTLVTSSWNLTPDGPPALYLDILDITTHPMTSRCHHLFEPTEVTANPTVIHFTTDGQQVVIGSWDYGLYLWDVQQCRMSAKPFVGHTKTVVDARFTPDSQYILSGSFDGTALLWDATTSAPLWQVDMISGVFGTAILPDRQKALLASVSGSIVEVELLTGKVLRAVETQDAPLCLELSPDGKTFATCGNSGQIHLWDSATLQEIGLLNGHTAPAIRLEFSADGRYLLSGSADHTARLWDTTTRTELMHIAHDNSVTDVALSADLNTAITSSFDGTLRLWDIPDLPPSL